MSTRKFVVNQCDSCGHEETDDKIGRHPKGGVLIPALHTTGTKAAGLTDVYLCSTCVSDNKLSLLTMLERAYLARGRKR